MQLLEDKEFLENGFELIEFYRQFPELAAKDLLNVDLAPIQKAVLRAMWDKNYVMSIQCRGSGKCVSGDTYLFTDTGITKIRELCSDVDILKETKFSISTGQGVSRSRKVYFDGVKPTTKLVTRKGYTIAITDDHPLLVMSDIGDLEWRRGCDIKNGDYLVMERGANVWGSKKVDPEYAYFLGLLVGNGCLSRDDLITFTNEDDDLLFKFQELSSRFLDYKPTISSSKDRARECRIYSTELRKPLLKEGLDRVLAPQKKIPTILLDATREALISFLQACFDTDGWFYPGTGEVGFCSSSPELAEIIHLLLLNLGIISKKSFRKNNKSNAYLIEMYGEQVKLFHQTVGFRSNRKNTLLVSYLNEKRKTNPNLDVIPNQKQRMRRMLDYARDTNTKLPLDCRTKLSRYALYYKPSYSGLKNITDTYPLITEDSLFLKTLVKRKYYFDKIVEKTYRAEKVYDLVMPEEAQHAFLANGFINHNTFGLAVFSCLKAMLYPGHRVGLIAPTFRQAKMIFDECSKLWYNSSVFQLATERKPTQQSDNCYIRFKASAGRNPSLITALPLGDGSKIRGSRFFTIVCDEFPHIPSEIFNTVIRPMAATTSNPMEKVRHLERQRELLSRGLITEEDIEREKKSTNQIIITSSGYFTFNHMYNLYSEYKKQMFEGNTKYKVFRIPYTFLPEGFLDEENVASAKREMSSLEFRMEYEADFIQDTESFYKASLLEQCSRTIFTTQVYGSPGKSYVLGIDPARTEDAFAVVVIELDTPCRIVHAVERYQITFPEMSTLIETLCCDFNVESIYMDSQGGGHAIKDLLAENRTNDGRGPILDPEDEVHRTKKGRHILKLCHPTNDFISDSNMYALRLLEHGHLLFASLPRDNDPNPAKEESWQVIQRMKMQMQTIEQSETLTGKYHFDVPKGEGHGKQKKDLYSAFMHAARCAYDTLWVEGLPENIIHHGGVFADREPKQLSLSNPLDGVSPYDIPQVIKDKIEIANNPDAFKRKILQQMQNKRTTKFSPAAVLGPAIKRKK